MTYDRQLVVDVNGFQPHAFVRYRQTSLCAVATCIADDEVRECMVPTDAYRRHPIHDLSWLGPIRRWLAGLIGPVR